MKNLTVIAFACCLAACASTPPPPAGMKSGQFVDFTCEDGKRMSARAAQDGSTVRVRFEGGYELDRMTDGSYEVDGWKLTTIGGSADLSHNGKVVARACKPT